MPSIRDINDEQNNVSLGFIAWKVERFSVSCSNTRKCPVFICESPRKGLKKSTSSRGIKAEIEASQLCPGWVHNVGWFHLFKS